MSAIEMLRRLITEEWASLEAMPLVASDPEILLNVVFRTRREAFSLDGQALVSLDDRKQEFTRLRFGKFDQTGLWSDEVLRSGQRKVRQIGQELLVKSMGSLFHESRQTNFYVDERVKARLPTATNFAESLTALEFIGRESASISHRMVILASPTNVACVEIMLGEQACDKVLSNLRQIFRE